MIERISSKSAEQLYTEEISKIPHLSEEESQKLGRRILEDDDGAARNELVEHYLGFAKSIALKTWLRFNNREKIPLEDLVQDANLGLIRAAQDFDYRKGTFGAYSLWWIKHNVNESLMNSGLIRIPINAQKHIRDLIKTSEELAGELKRPPTIKEIAKRVGLSDIVVSQMLNSLNTHFVSLNASVGDEEKQVIGDFIPSTTTLSPEQAQMARDELREARASLGAIEAKLVQTCSPKQIAAMRLFYDGFGEAGEQKTINEAAEQLGVSNPAVQEAILRGWRLYGFETNSLRRGTDPISKARRRISTLNEIVEAIDSKV